MKFKIKYLIIWIIFIAFIFLIWYFFAFKNWIQDLDKRLTYILTTFGLVFSIFQYWMSTLKDKDRFLAQLRIEEYRQIRQTIQEYFNILNIGLSEGTSLTETENKLINIKNELAVLIKSNHTKLFPGIMDLEPSKKLDSIFEKILLETSKARQKYQKILDSDSVRQNFEIEVLKMEWDSNIRDDFKEAFSVRDNLIQILQSKILL